MEAAKQITGVERRFTVDSVADLDKKPTVTLHFVEKNEISKFQQIEGDKFSIDEDGIWLDTLFAKARGLKVGDSIKLSVNGYAMNKKIKGLVVSPEYVYYAGKDDIMPVHSKYGFGFLSYKSYPKDIPFTYTELMITADGLTVKKLETTIDKALDGKYSVFLPRKNLKSYMQFSEEIKEHKAISEIFPIAFLAVAILTIVTTMSRMVNNQRTQIGILKAVGFKRRRILFHYVSYGLWISLAGTILGEILGPLTLPYLFYGPMQTAYTLPQWSSKVPAFVIYIGVISIIISILATYFACRKVLKDTPTESLRPKAPKSVKHSFIDSLRIWRHLSFHSQWNIRDVFRCKGRSIMAIIGILGCTALLICAFSMQDTLDYVVNWNYNIINQYKSKLILDENISNEQVDDIINQYGGEKIQEGSVEIKARNEKHSGEILITDHVSLIHFVNKNCKEIKLPNDQVSISYKMAKLLNIKSGDQISWHVYGEEKWNTAKVGAIYRTPLSQGITMTRKVYEDYGYSFLPTAVISNKDLSGRVKKANNDGVTKVQAKKELVEGYNRVSETMNTMVYVLIIAATVLAVVVIYNLGVLSFTERQRELSTLKVVGFKTRDLRRLLLTQNIWLTLAGILPGIPIGIFMLGYIFRFLGDVLDFFIVTSFSSYVYSAFGTMLISILVNRLFSKRVKEIDMVSSLKGVE